jgi:dTDP-4-dehydrorhamnose reductase
MSENILILGSYGYMGNAVTSRLIDKGRSIQLVSCYAISSLQKALEKATLVINCAAYIPAGGVSLCDHHKTECLDANVIFPARLAALCSDRGIPLIHLSTGCLYDESKEWIEEDSPLRGWENHCGTYVGSKLLAERAVAQWKKSWILRLRLPFDEYDHPKNYLSKLCRFDTVYQHINSMTHRQDFADVVLQIVEERPDFGTYHVVNHGQIAASYVVSRLILANILTQEPPKLIDTAHCSGCRLSTEKLRAAGLKIRHISDALDEAIKKWKPKK